jgi:hypothetical protein
VQQVGIGPSYHLAHGFSGLSCSDSPTRETSSSHGTFHLDVSALAENSNQGLRSLRNQECTKGIGHRVAGTTVLYQGFTKGCKYLIEPPFIHRLRPERPTGSPRQHPTIVARRSLHSILIQGASRSGDESCTELGPWRWDEKCFSFA